MEFLRNECSSSLIGGIGVEAQEFLDTLSKIQVWRNNGGRAPNKPLLILFALARVLRDEPRLFSFEEEYNRLQGLLEEFGRPRTMKQRSEYAFVRLVNDGIWQVVPESLNTKMDYSHRTLFGMGVEGGFSPLVHQLLAQNHTVVYRAIEQTLRTHFPESYHQDVLCSIGLETYRVIQNSRNPDFRDRVLHAYEESCAICGYNVRLLDKPVGLEAAHIKWFKAGGPDTEANGIALCSLHHILFDRGAFTLTEQMRVKVSAYVGGTIGTTTLLTQYHDRTITLLNNSLYYPEMEYVSWHVSEVFRDVML